MTDVPLSLNVLNGGKDTYFPSDRLSGRMKAKGKTHVCFPNRCLFQPALALQAAPPTPNLTLAVAAVVALFAAFFVHHRVAAALGTQVPVDAHMAHTQQADGLFVMTVVVILVTGKGRGFSFVFRQLLFHLVEVYLQRARHGVWHR